MQNNDIKYEPMDIDLSSSSAADMDISYIEPALDPDIIIKQERLDSYTTEILPDEAITVESKGQELDIRNRGSVGSIKKYHIIIEKKIKKPRNAYYVPIKFILSAIALLCVSIFTHYLLNFKCHDRFDLESVTMTLSKNIYGQAGAIEIIVETLAMNVSSKILFLYGGTGVGKTFATSLILQESWNSANIYHYTMPTFATTFSADFMLGLTICKTSMLIVDDLTTNDMHIKPLIKDVIEKSESLGKNITVILIFNCENITKDFTKKCDDSFHVKLKRSFGDVNAKKHFIMFDPLKEQHLMKCIEKELGNKEMSKKEMNNILKNFNVSLDGCKGVHTKIKSLS